MLPLDVSVYKYRGKGDQGIKEYGFYNNRKVYLYVEWQEESVERGMSGRMVKCYEEPDRQTQGSPSRGERKSKVYMNTA